MIVACGNIELMSGPVKDFWIQDCSAAIENILLAATRYGVRITLGWIVSS